MPSLDNGQHQPDGRTCTHGPSLAVALCCRLRGAASSCDCPWLHVHPRTQTVENPGSASLFHMVRACWLVPCRRLGNAEHLSVISLSTDVCASALGHLTRHARSPPKGNRPSRRHIDRDPGPRAEKKDSSLSHESFPPSCHSSTLRTFRSSSKPSPPSPKTTPSRCLPE